MHRVSMATGAQTQTTVNNLNPKVLGTVEAFEEKQACSAFGPASFALVPHLLPWLLLLLPTANTATAIA